MVDREIPAKKAPGQGWASPAYEALERKRTDEVGNPKDLSPEGGLQEWDGDSSRPAETSFCVTMGNRKCLATCHSVCVPLSMCVLRAHEQGMHDSLATCVILEPHVFNADFKYLFHGKQRHLVSFYNPLVVIE